MIDVWIPTLDGRWLVLPRYTQPEQETKLLLDQLELTLPSQPVPRITAYQTITPPPLPSAESPALW